MQLPNTSTGDWGLTLTANAIIELQTRTIVVTGRGEWGLKRVEDAAKGDSPLDVFALQNISLLWSQKNQKQNSIASASLYRSVEPRRVVCNRSSKPSSTPIVAELRGAQSLPRLPSFVSRAETIRRNEEESLVEIVISLRKMIHFRNPVPPVHFCRRCGGWRPVVVVINGRISIVLIQWASPRVNYPRHKKL